MSICQNLADAPHTDFICILPVGHAGNCDFIDAMGICGNHDDCRASSTTAYRTARENAIEHHPRCPARSAQVVTR